VQFAYVANGTSNDVSQYSIEADGTLSPLAPPTVATGDAPVSVTVDPSGQFAYVASENSSDVSQYRIEADGSLTPLVPAEVDAGRHPTAITTVAALE
jgi:6-phosphogluconolactonase (cycloisomerase 2 family)